MPRRIDLVRAKKEDEAKASVNNTESGLFNHVIREPWNHLDFNTWVALIINGPLLATAQELNSMVGVNPTLTGTELNILDGATLTTTQLNFVTGVTAPIQAQINGRLTIAQFNSHVAASDPHAPYLKADGSKDSSGGQLFSGHIAAGNTASVDATKIINAKSVVTDTGTGVVTAAQFDITVDGSPFVGYPVIGMNIAATYEATPFSGGSLTGIKAVATQNSTSGIQNLIGLYVNRETTVGTGSVVSSYGIQVDRIYSVSPTVSIGMFIADQGDVGVSIAVGVSISKQTNATNSHGLFLFGDGIGADIIFGAGFDANMYYNGVDLVINPKIVGSGILDVQSGIKIANDLDHNGSNVGFYGVAPTARPAAYTQTYSTSTRTHAALTSSVLTDSTGGSADTTVQDVTASHNQAILNDNFSDLIAQNNALRTDLENVKQVLNQMLDDDQLIGLKQ